MSRAHRILLVGILVGLSTACHRSHSNIILLRASKQAGVDAADDWNRFLGVVEAQAKNAGLAPMPRDNERGCVGWSMGTKGLQRLVVYACPMRDDHDVHYDTSVSIITGSMGWPIAGEPRLATVQSGITEALRSNFGDRIEVGQ